MFYLTVALLCRFLPFPQLCPERAFKASNYICTAHLLSIVYYAFSKFNKPLKKMSIPVQLHLGVMEIFFLFFAGVELIHSSTLPMQIQCYLYPRTWKKQFVASLICIVASLKALSLTKQHLRIQTTQEEHLQPMKGSFYFYFLIFGLGTKLISFRNDFPPCTLHSANHKKN